jgi:polyferredoxin
MAATSVPHAPHTREKKKLIRRLHPDRSQQIRHAVQGAFALLNAWIAIQFFLWVRYFEHGSTGWAVPRPAGAEGWLPIAGLMNLKYFLSTGKIPAVHPAAMFLFGAFLLMSLLLKKAFCSWLCPVGTLSEAVAALGRRIFGRNLHPPKAVDIPLRALKYLLLAFFGTFIGFMSAVALLDFMNTPYGLMADVKMLNFFRNIGPTAAIVIAILLLLSIRIQNFWCRYLCPYGALLGLASFFSPIKIRRDTRTCIDCGKCAHACPSQLPVDKLIQIRSAECNACMACVAACQAQDALQLALPPRHDSVHGPVKEPRWYRRKIGPVAMTCLLAYIFFGIVLYARVTNHWQADLPHAVYQELIPRVSQLSHPGM